MKWFFLNAVVFLAVNVFAGSAAAQPLPCDEVSDLARPEFALPRVAAAIKAGELKVSVIGSSSSALPPQAGVKAAYPGQLEAALSEKFPNLKVKVRSYAQSKRTAADMAGDFERIIEEDKPALVVWQTGTVDAMRGVDPDEFRATLEEGIETLHTGGADTLLINMQYSPRTESIIAVNVYAETIHLVAMQQQVPLFDRFAIMKLWNELGVFDLYAATREFSQAARVHKCLGRLLTDLIADAAAMTQADGPPAKERQ